MYVFIYILVVVFGVFRIDLDSTRWSKCCLVSEGLLGTLRRKTDLVFMSIVDGHKHQLVDLY